MLDGRYQDTWAARRRAVDASPLAQWLAERTALRAARTVDTPAWSTWAG